MVKELKQKVNQNIKYNYVYFANSADYVWDTYTDSIPSPSDNVQVRFRAYGDNSFNIDAFIVDNVSLSSVSGGGSRDFIDGDFIGYNVYIDSSQSRRYSGSALY